MGVKEDAAESRQCLICAGIRERQTLNVVFCCCANPRKRIREMAGDARDLIASVKESEKVAPN